MTRPPAPGLGYAWGLAIACFIALLIAGTSAFWQHYTVAPTPDGAAVVELHEVGR